MVDPSRRGFVSVLAVLLSTGWAANHFASLIPVLRIHEGLSPTVRPGRPRHHRPTRSTGRSTGNNCSPDVAQHLWTHDWPIDRGHRSRLGHRRGHGLGCRPQGQSGNRNGRSCSHIWICLGPLALRLDGTVRVLSLDNTVCPICILVGRFCCRCGDVEPGTHSLHRRTSTVE